MSYEIGNAVVYLSQSAEKQAAAAPELSYGLCGKLYLSNSGFLLLSVPNALGRGAFDALNEPGVELPPAGSSGQYNAHISVMRPDEVEQIGGPSAISERGHEFSYTLGPVRCVEPAGWAEMARCWFIEVRSPDLEKLRKSYGLPGLPNGDHQFHITFAVRRRNVLRAGDTTKSRGSLIHDPAGYFSKAAAVDPNYLEDDAELTQLAEAKLRSDQKDWTTKTQILRNLMTNRPENWMVDSSFGSLYGLTHQPTGYKFHLPALSVPDGINRDAIASTLIKQAGVGWEIKDSPIDGKGLFATRDYKLGDIVVRNAMTKLPDNDGRTVYDQSDASRYTNHADDANIEVIKRDGYVDFIAIADIAAGTELTGNYDKTTAALGPALSYTYRNKPYGGQDSGKSHPDASRADDSESDGPPGPAGQAGGSEAGPGFVAGGKAGTEHADSAAGAAGCTDVERQSALSGDGATTAAGVNTQSDAQPVQQDVGGRGSQVPFGRRDSTGATEKRSDHRATQAILSRAVAALFAGTQGSADPAAYLPVAGASADSFTKAARARVSGGVPSIHHRGLHHAARNSVLQSAAGRAVDGAIWGRIKSAANGSSIAAASLHGRGRGLALAGQNAAGSGCSNRAHGWTGTRGLLIKAADNLLKTAGLREELIESIAQARLATATDPTDAQKESGNYAKGKFTMHGLQISLENPAGSTRSGTDKNGKAWSTTMAHDYGYIRGTVSEADADHVDVFVGPNPESYMVFVVDQNDPATGKFDEHKCMLGFKTKAEAEAGYRACYDKDWKGFAGIHSMHINAFRKWLETGNTGKAAVGQKLTR